MKNLISKLTKFFYKAPIMFTFVISFCISFSFSVIMWTLRYFNVGPFSYSFDYGLSASLFSILQGGFVYVIFALPITLTLLNILFLILPPRLDNNSSAHKKVEVFGLFLGLFFSFLSFSLYDIKFVDWNVAIYHFQTHFPIYTRSLATVLFILFISFVGYVYCRFKTLKNQPPLATVLGIASMYLGVAVSITWCIQIYNVSLLLMILPINYIIIILKTVRYLVYEKSKFIEDEIDTNVKFPKLNKLVCNSKNWPWLGIVAMLPLLGIVIAILILMGQKPDSIIKAWTETADWTFSKQIPPASLPSDGHYLCTVAAGGHKEVVKPLRDGNRHGHKILVNRQLCIANAFEQVIEEKVPKFHSFIRGAYDKYGYPIATKINSPIKADITYYLMKPLEWIFLITLYLVDNKPENRIAVQYPHKPIPYLNKNSK